MPIHGDSVKGSCRDEETHSATGLPQFKVIVGSYPNQTTHRVALVDAQGGVEIAPHRFKGRRAGEGGAPLVPDGIAPVALTMVGLSAFAGRIDRAAAHRPLLTRERLGRGKGIIGWHRHRFIQQPATDRREGDVKLAVLVDLQVGAIGKSPSPELPNDLLPGIEERGTRTTRFSDPSCPSHRAKVGVFALGHTDANALVIALRMVD